MPIRPFRRTALCSATAAALVFAMPLAVCAQEATYRFDIPAQELGAALRAFAQAARQQITFDNAVVQGRTSTALEGHYTIDDGMRRLLGGTGLELRRTQNGVLYVVDPAAVPAAPPPPGDEADRQVPGVAAVGRVQELERIVVTGTHIAGVPPVGVPIVMLRRDDIDRSGYSTVEQVLETLPQNFSGGEAEKAAFVPSPRGNTVFGTGANLRGLGSQSTLTLLNGRRLAPAGTANYIDLSMIPLSAVDRVEILLDGASAQYGSDAVGGVVNIVLREGYDGAETVLGRAHATEGGAAETRVSQTFGRSWDRFDAMLSYEHYERDPLFANERDYVSSQPLPLHLLSAQERQSILYSTELRIGDGTTIGSHGFVTNRKTDNLTYQAFLGVPVIINNDVDQYSWSFTGRQAFGRDWSVRFSIDRSAFEADTLTAFPGIFETTTSQKSTVTNGELIVDGTLFSTGAGEAKLAVGIGARRENLRALDTQPADGRNVKYGFAEVMLPLVSRDQRVPLVNDLRLSVSARHERYSDFGSSTNPHVGLEWAPTEGLGFRATYGRSFRAPSLFDLDDSSEVKQVLDIPDGAGGFVRSIDVGGGNAALTAERSKTWTAGFDWRLESARNLELAATYYDIHYTDRISTIGGNVFTALTDPVFAPVVTLASDPEYTEIAAQFLSRGIFFGCLLPVDPVTGACPEPASAFGAVIDERLLNLSEVRTRGIDFQMNLNGEAGRILWDAFINATYALDFDRKISETAPLDSILDTGGNPLDLRVRGGLSARLDGWTFSATRNYSGGYKTNNSPTAMDVGSWTTLDLFLAYEFERSGSALDGLRVSLSANNALNEAPPRYPQVAAFTFPGLNYDPANSNPLGRVISLRIAKTW